MNANREWISTTDLMSGLMMVFLFISIMFMLYVDDKKNDMTNIAKVYEENREMLNWALHEEFDKDLENWDAEILNNNTVRFRSPEILFARGSTEIKDTFRVILNDFFPRYVRILTQDKFINNIEELRIEGHTSSIWRYESTEKEKYLLNAALSQGRSFSVLTYIYSLEEIGNQQDWLRGVIRANGLSYAKRIFDQEGNEDFERSRRVEFRVVTKAEEKIYQILEKAELW